MKPASSSALRACNAGTCPKLMLARPFPPKEWHRLVHPTASRESSVMEADLCGAAALLCSKIEELATVGKNIRTDDKSIGVHLSRNLDSTAKCAHR